MYSVLGGIAALDILVNCAGIGLVGTIEETEALNQRQPIGRPEEIAHMVLYLCSAEAAFVTGSVLTIDGGWTAA